MHRDQSHSDDLSWVTKRANVFYEALVERVAQELYDVDREGRARHREHMVPVPWVFQTDAERERWRVRARGAFDEVPDAVA